MQIKRLSHTSFLKLYENEMREKEKKKKGTTN